MKKLLLLVGLLAVLGLSIWGVRSYCSVAEVPAPKQLTEFVFPDCSSNTDANKTALLTRTIDKLRYDRDDWYADQIRNKISYYVLSCLCMLSSLVTSILVALQFEKPEGQSERARSRWKMALVILPAVSAVSITALTQFKIKEIWSLRIEGVNSAERIQHKLLVEGCDAKTIERAHSMLIDMEERQYSLDHMLTTPSESVPWDTDKAQRRLR